MAAAGLSAYATVGACQSAPGSSNCDLGKVATGFDYAGLFGGQAATNTVTGLGGTAAAGAQASAGVTVLLAPVTLGYDGYFFYDAVTAPNPYWYEPPSPSDITGVG